MPIIQTKNRTLNNQQLLNEVLREMRRLKQEVSVIVPQEDLKSYTHPSRIKKSYQRALKQFPFES